MRLLFDQNLSHKLVKRLADVFPDSLHVRDIGMRSASDPVICELCTGAEPDDRQQGCRFPCSAFRARRTRANGMGQAGNGSTDQVEQALRQRRTSIEALADDSSQVIEIL